MAIVRAAVVTCGPTVSTGSGASEITPTLASSPHPEHRRRHPVRAGLQLPDRAHRGRVAGPPARIAPPGGPAFQRMAGPRPVRHMERRPARLDHGQRHPLAALTDVRCAVAPTVSASRRSAGSAASATSGWARRARCSTPAPRRSRPDRSRRTMPCSVSVATSRYTTARPTPSRCRGLGHGQAARGRRRPGAAGAGPDPGSAPSRHPQAPGCPAHRGLPSSPQQAAYDPARADPGKRGQLPLYGDATPV